MMPNRQQAAIPVMRGTKAATGTIAIGNRYGEQSYNHAPAMFPDAKPLPNNVRHLISRGSRGLPEELTEKLEIVLGTLDDRSKDLLRRFYVGNETVQTIAETWRISAGQVQMILYNTRKLLRQTYLELAERNVDRYVIHVIQQVASSWRDNAAGHSIERRDDIDGHRLA